MSGWHKTRCWAQLNFMTEKVKLEFNQKDLKELIAEKYNLKPESVYLVVSHWKGDAREPEYTSIVVEGIKKDGAS